MLRTLSMSELKVGMDVVFVDDTLNVHPTCFVDVPFESNVGQLRGRKARIVRVQPDIVGKKVGIVFQEKIEGGLSLDNMLPPKYAEHGAWVLPEHLYTPEMHQEHIEAAAAVGVDRTEVEKALEGFLP